MTFELQPGTDVEVMSTFDHDWKRGFVVERTCDQGYHLRRRSDDSILPTPFPPDAVRALDPTPPALPQ